MLNGDGKTCGRLTADTKNQFIHPGTDYTEQLLLRDRAISTLSAINYTQILLFVSAINFALFTCPPLSLLPTIFPSPLPLPAFSHPRDRMNNNFGDEINLFFSFLFFSVDPMRTKLIVVEENERRNCDLCYKGFDIFYN